MAAFSARNSRVVFNSANLFAMKWTVNVKVDELDVSNFEGQGYTQVVGGLWEADVSMDIIWDGSTSDFVNGVFPGFKANLQLFYDTGRAVNPVGTAQASADTRKWNFAQVMICTVSQDAEVRGFLKYSVTAKNDGIFTMPNT